MEQLLVPDAAITTSPTDRPTGRPWPWGGMALFRGGRHAVLRRRDHVPRHSLSGYAVGLRVGLLTPLQRFPRGVPPAPPADAGPAVAIFDAEDRVVQVSVGATRLLAEMTSGRTRPARPGTLAALVAGARRFQDGTSDVPARGRVRLPSGRWLVLRASPLELGRRSSRRRGHHHGGPGLPEIVRWSSLRSGWTERNVTRPGLVRGDRTPKEIAAVSAPVSLHGAGPPKGRVRQGRRAQPA